MAQRLLLLPSEGERPDCGPMLGSQVLLQALLELGEAYLGSEIGEDDLKDLEAKISAARSRDYNTIRDLQKKIEELSGMGAMVSRLKDELIEEKEKAKEDAEDLTQEMAELRYTLMERVEQERELRAHTEQASLRRISELEEQLKHARQEISVLLARKQSADANAQARALELQHLKSAFEMLKQSQSSLIIQKDQIEKDMTCQLQELKLIVTSLETDLSKTALQLQIAEEKVDHLENASNDLKKENEERLSAAEQQKGEALLRLEVAELKLAQLEHASLIPKTEGEELEKLLILENNKEPLEQGIADMLQLIADFKLQLQLLAEEYCKAEVKILHKAELRFSPVENNTYSECSLSQCSQELPAQATCSGCQDSSSCISNDLLSNDKEGRNVQNVTTFLQAEDMEKSHISPRKGIEMREASSTVDIYCKEESGKENEDLLFQSVQSNSESHFSIGLGEHDMDLQNLDSSFSCFSPCHPVSLTTSNSLADTNVKEQEWPWVVQEVVEMVASMTEELTQSLRLVLKCPLSRLEFLSSLESRLQTWSDVPQETLPDRVVVTGAITDWGDLVVDIVGQCCRELQAMQQKVWDLEAQIEVMERIRADFNALNMELTYTKEKLPREESCFASEMARKEDVMHALERKLEHADLDLLCTEKKVKEQEETICSLLGQCKKAELEAEREKSTRASEKRQLNETLREQYENMQKERAWASKEMGKLEKRVDELQHRLTENEQELEELMATHKIDIDAVVAIKMKRLEQNLNDSHSLEARLQAERAELASQVVWLQAKLEEAERELQAENEQHVEVLIEYEEEHAFMMAELEAAKHHSYLNQTDMNQTSTEKGSSTSLVNPKMRDLTEGKMHGPRKLGEMPNNLGSELLAERNLRFETEQKQRELSSTLEKTLVQLSVLERKLELAKQKIEHMEKSFRSSESKLLRTLEEKKTMQDAIETLKQNNIEKDLLLASQREELSLQKENNKNLMDHATSLDSELFLLRQQQLMCESQANEMGLTIVNLQEALMLERLKTSQAQEDTNLQMKRLTRQDEDYLQLKMKYNALLTSLESLQANLGESRKREGEARVQVKKLELEFSLAKEEVVKSEVRLQKTLKQKEEQLEAERSKLEAAINAQKQSNWLLHRQIEQLKGLEAEKVELQRHLAQVRETCDRVEKERDDLKVAYAELENQFSRRRVAISK